MIPLSNWLSASDRAGAHMPDLQVSCTVLSNAEEEQAHAAAVEEALLRGRLEGAAVAAEAWELKLAAIEEAHAAALETLRAEADQRLSTAIVDGIADAVSAQRMEIETALGSVLQPFLAKQASRAAAAELARLIDEDLRQQSSPSFEIKAPAALHEVLRGYLAEKSIACVLTEADDIRLISAQGSLRYESLADRWIAALEGNPA